MGHDQTQPSLADYRKYVSLRIEALNHALAGIPPEKVRYHSCWGSWHGAHVNDIPLEHIIDIALKVKAQTYSFEAANVRHQHEIGVWKEVKLALGTIQMPGVISHATNIVEHPQLVARRLADWATMVGRENVVGGADCGMGRRVHAEIGTRSRRFRPPSAHTPKRSWPTFPTTPTSSRQFRSAR
jgi:5-methyltetrahydropteroyltriglutamate--homocysteine methyltransferase